MHYVPLGQVWALCFTWYARGSKWVNSSPPKYRYNLQIVLSTTPWNPWGCALHVGKFFIPYDSILMEIEEDAEILIILGRPFLATIGAIVNVKMGGYPIGALWTTPMPHKETHYPFGRRRWRHFGVWWSPKEENTYTRIPWRDHLKQWMNWRSSSKAKTWPYPSKRKEIASTRWCH